MSFRKAAIALIALALSSPSLGQHWTDFVPLDPRTAESGRPYLTAPRHQLDDPVSQALLADTPFQKYLTYQRYRVVVGDAPPYEGGFVHGPGHHISAIAALVFDPHGTPYATLKSGDTRLARALRAEPYVATSGIAGRWDKKGASAADIVLGELAEEIGGHPIEGTFRRLGESLSPTMPFESTESDEYFSAAVKIDASPYGDGGQMEVVGLIGPVFLVPRSAIMAMDSGEISDAARARTMFGRAWDAMRARPSAALRSQSVAAASIKKRESGTAAFTASAKASLPLARTKLSGSCSAGRNRNLTLRVSVASGRAASSALRAARRPALSPSKLNTTESVKRNSFCTWSGVQAVPKVATALANPSCARATTSM